LELPLTLLRSRCSIRRPSDLVCSLPKNNSSLRMLC
jgi:hypothetical protein